jgi:hypothetical protein
VATQSLTASAVNFPWIRLFSLEMKAGCFVAALVATLLSAFMLYLLVLGPASAALKARKWEPVPCTVISSGYYIPEWSGGTTSYRLQIRYRYSYRGRTYTGDRYDLLGTTHSGTLDRTRRIVEQVPPGLKTTCYANPAAPEQSVLKRGFPARMWWGVIPLLLLSFGILGMILAWIVDWSPSRR